MFPLKTDSDVSYEVSKNLTNIQALLSRCKAEAKKVFESSRPTDSTRWISSIRQSEDILELCCGELCGMLANLGCSSLENTFHLLQHVHRTNFEYLLKGYLFLFRKWEENTATTVGFGPSSYRGKNILYKEDIKCLELPKETSLKFPTIKNEMRSISPPLLYYKHQRGFEKKDPKSFKKLDKVVNVLTASSQPHQQDPELDDEPIGTSNFIATQRLFDEEQEFVRHVEALLTKRRLIPESKIPQVIKYLDEIIKKFGDAAEEFDLLDETIEQKLSRVKKNQRPEAKAIKPAEQNQHDASPEGAVKESGTEIVNPSQEGENNALAEFNAIVEFTAQDIEKMKKELKKKNDTILELKAIIKEKETINSELDAQSKHYIFLSTQQRIDLKGLKLAFDEESEKLQKERQLKHVIEEKLERYEATNEADKQDLVRTMLEKMTLEVENDYLRERLGSLEPETSQKNKKPSKNKVKVVRRPKESKSTQLLLIQHAIDKMTGGSMNGSGLDTKDTKEDMPTTFHTLGLATKTENDSIANKDNDLKGVNKSRVEENLSPPPPAHILKIDRTQSENIKKHSNAADHSLHEVRVKKISKNKATAFNINSNLTTEEDAANEEESKNTEIYEEMEEKTLLKSFVPRKIQLDLQIKRQQMMEAKRAHFMSSRDREAFTLRRKSTLAPVGGDNNLPNNFIDRAAEKLPLITCTSNIGYDDFELRGGRVKSELEKALPTVEKKSKRGTNKNYWGILMKANSQGVYKGLRSQSNDMYESNYRQSEFFDASLNSSNLLSGRDKELTVQNFSRIYETGANKWLTGEDDIEFPDGSPDSRTNDERREKIVIEDLGRQREKEIEDLYECLLQNIENIQVFNTWLKEIALSKCVEESPDKTLVKLEAEIEFIQSLKSFGRFREFFLKCLDTHKTCGQDCIHINKFRERIKIMISTKLKANPIEKNKKKHKK